MKRRDDIGLADLPRLIANSRCDRVTSTRSCTHADQYLCPLGRTELRDTFDTEGVRRLKDATLAPLAIGGGQLASILARTRLLDEAHAIVALPVLGGVIRLFDKALRLDLDLFDEHRFRSGLRTPQVPRATGVEMVSLRDRHERQSHAPCVRTLS